MRTRVRLKVANGDPIYVNPGLVATIGVPREVETNTPILGKSIVCAVGSPPVIVVGSPEMVDALLDRVLAVAAPKPELPANGTEAPRG